MAHLIWTGPHRLKLRYDCVNNDSNIAPSTKIINNFETAGHIIHRSRLDHPTTSELLSFLEKSLLKICSLPLLWYFFLQCPNWDVIQPAAAIVLLKKKKKISIFNNLKGYFHKNARVLPLESRSVDQEGKHFIERQHWRKKTLLDILNHKLCPIFAENGLKDESLN